MSTALPTTISYLQPVLTILEHRSTEYASEEWDTTYLCVLLKKRIEGLTKARAIAQIDEDRDALESVLEYGAIPAAALVVGFLLESAQVVLHLRSFKPPAGWRPPKPGRRKQVESRISIDLPKAFKQWRDGPGICVEHGKNRYVISPGRSPSMKQLMKSLKQCPTDEVLEFEEVEFDTLKGYRVLRDGSQSTLHLKSGSRQVSIFTVEGDWRLIEKYVNSIVWSDAAV